MYSYRIAGVESTQETYASKGEWITSNLVGLVLLILRESALRGRAKTKIPCARAPTDTLIPSLWTPIPRLK